MRPVGKRRFTVSAQELLGAPYRAPPLRKGTRATCLYRDADVVITSWSDAPISWPRCRRLSSSAGGGSGLLVNDELVRALRTESSIAMQYWFGIKGETVWRWRKAFNIDRWGTEGSKTLHRELSEAGARITRGRPRPREAVRRTMATRMLQGYRPPPNRWKQTGWNVEQLALLGTAPDEAIASRIGRTAVAVRVMRIRRGIPSFSDRRRRANKWHTLSKSAADHASNA
jgi:hypothetical protein